MNIFRQALLLLFCLISSLGYSQVGIGTTNPQGALDINSSNLGLILPRVSSYEDVTTPSGGSPVDGTMAYDTTLKRLILYIDGSWIAIGKNASGSGGAFSVPGAFEGTQVGLAMLGEFGGDSFGRAVSISDDGSIVAVGGIGNDANSNNSGHVRVFENVADVWTQIGSDIDGTGNNANFGSAISLSADGSVVAVGAPGNSDNGSASGHVRVYENISGVWTKIGLDIRGEASLDYSGTSVSMSSDGSIVAIGAKQNDGNGSNSGHVRVYENISGVWTKIGSDINGDAAGDNFGFSVSLSSDGSILAAGATGNADNGLDAGHVKIFENIAGVWTQVGADIDGEAAYDVSGCAVSLSADGSIVAIGAFLNSGNGSSSGHVRVYENLSGTWTQIGSDIDGEAPTDYSGESISLSSDGNTLAIGARLNDGFGTFSGHVRIYRNVSGVWVQSGPDIDGENAGDQSGYLSLSGDGTTVIIGATGNSAGGHARVFK